MIPLLFLLLFSSLFVVVYYWTRGLTSPLSLREVFLGAITLLGLPVVAITEGLSFFSLLTRPAVAALWGVALALSVGACVLVANKRPETYSVLWRDIKAAAWEIRSSRATVVLLALILFHFAVLLFILYLYPVPNNIDAMHYHLARTAHWEQQASLAHYPTHNLLQLWFTPFAEFAFLQVNMLAGKDLLAASVQWVAMLGSVVGVSEIARRLGANAFQQVVAALLCVTIPMGILQATSTQNDYVSALWLVYFVVFGMRFAASPNGWFNIASAGSALGLALLTKGSAYILALPFCIWFGAAALRAQRFQWPAWRAGLLIALLALSINLGYYSRNMALFGSPFGSAAGTLNETFSLGALASNAIRNIQIHSLPHEARTPSPWREIGAVFSAVTWRLHTFTGMDNGDTRTTMNVYDAFEDPHGLRVFEIKSGNFAHLLLILAAAPIALWKPNEEKTQQYFLTLAAAFLLFSLLLKANVWMSRLQLPIFVLACPVIAVTVFRLKREWAVALCVGIWLASFPWLFENPFRPLDAELTARLPYSRGVSLQGYFAYGPHLLPIYEVIADRIKDSGCERVGLVLTSQHRQEYPFWMVMRAKGYTGRMEDVLVSNVSKRVRDKGFEPCAVVSAVDLGSQPGFTLVKVNTFWLYMETSP